MLSIIQLVTPPWAALPDREPAHWSYAIGKSGTEREREGKRRGKMRTMVREGGQIRSGKKRREEAGIKENMTRPNELMLMIW